MTHPAPPFLAHALGPRWPLYALAAALAMLAAAHGFERIGGYAPCALCLRQREVYWGAAALAVVGLVAARFLAPPLVLRVTCALLGLAFLTGAVVAGYHAGVEWKFWPGPSTCSATGGGALSAAAVLEALGEPNKVVPCDQTAWRLFGVSMAGYNTLISLGLAVLSAGAALLIRPPEELHD